MKFKKIDYFDLDELEAFQALLNILFTLKVRSDALPIDIYVEDAIDDYCSLCRNLLKRCECRITFRHPLYED